MLETPRTAAGLKAAMDSQLPVGQSTDIAFSVTGEEYVERYHAEPDEETACAKAWEFFLSDVGSRLTLDRGIQQAVTLYWRTPPEWSAGEEDGVAWSRLYLRYLISEKRPVSTDRETLLRIGHGH
jgi:hypothetical protein